MFAQNEKEYKPWTDDVCKLLLESRSGKVLAMIDSLTNNQKSKSSFNLAGYIKNNIDNIDYKAYKAQGFFIGSGAIESSNKSVIQRRVKLPGMRWNLDSLQYVTTLMTKLKSDRWETDVVAPSFKRYGLTPGKKFKDLLKQT